MPHQIIGILIRFLFQWGVYLHSLIPISYFFTVNATMRQFLLLVLMLVGVTRQACAHREQEHQSVGAEIYYSF